MRLGLVLLPLIAGSCAAPQPGAPSRPPVELAGRTAGAPQRCVLITPSDSLRVSDTDRHTLIYGGGKTVWANHLGPGCGFGSDDALVTEPVGSYDCRGDIVRSFDRFTRISGPTCVLGDFVPYTRP